MPLADRLERSRRTPLVVDVAFYALCAAFAGYTAWWSALPSHAFWGAIAVGGYLPAALVCASLLSRYALPVAARLWIALGATVAVTVMPLLAQAWQRADGVAGRAQEEVQVVEDSAARLWETGSPYLSVDEIAAATNPLLAYNPYQPGMAVFGLPRALAGESWLTDARIWFALATGFAVWYAVRLLAHSGTRLPLRIRAIQAVGVLPVCALTLATGGDDLPVLAGCLLALAALASGRYTLAACAVGTAAALKLFAWPVLIVVVVYAVHKRQSWRVVPYAFGVPLLVLTPVALADTADYLANTVEFPLGQGVAASPAASPLPGYLLANLFTAGPFVAMGLLIAAAVAIGGHVLRHPPGSPREVAGVCALGLLAAILLMPASRFGYLLYPAALGVWWWVLKRGRVPSGDTGT